MITLSIRYHTPLRQARGVKEEQVTLPDGTSLGLAVGRLVENGSPALRGMLLEPDGTLSPHLVVFRNNSLMADERYDAILADGDELMLFLAISGGKR